MKEAKRAVRAILHETRAAGNGGFVADFGLLTYSKLVKFSGFKKGKKEREYDN